MWPFSVKEWDYDSVPSLEGKVAIITGASAGLGKVTCMELARKGAHVFCLGRSKEKTELVIKEIMDTTGNSQVEFLQADLTDLASVQSAAETFLARNLPLHILVNNAGIMAVPFRLSKQDIESQFATNHFAHFLFTLLLLPTMIKTTPSARIVNLTSMAHRAATVPGGIDFDNMNKEETYNPWAQYGQTKLANILFTKELTRHLEAKGVHHVYVNAAHPGGVSTDLARESANLNFVFRGILHMFMVTPEHGAKTQVFLATDPSVESLPIKGKYYVPTAKEEDPTPDANSEDLAKRLWEFTENVLKEKGFPVTY